MAENVAVTTLEIKGTEKVATTMKELKAQIQAYRDELVALGQVEDKNEAQMQEQVRVTEKLQKATQLLSDVTNAHKKVLTENERAIDASIDSYNALQAEMSKLKKAYKDMTAAERESDFGRQTLNSISALDSKLKVIDSEMGQYQRNVGNYGRTFEESMQVTRQSSGYAAQGLGTLSGIIALAGVQNEGLAKTIAGVTLAMQVMQNEGVTKLLVKLKELIASKIAVKAAGEAQSVESEATATAMEEEAVATTTATAATNKFKKALIGIGIGAVVAAIGALIANWEKVSKALGFATSKQKELNNAMKEGVTNAAKGVVELNLYQKVATDVTRAEKERDLAARSLLETLGETINETTILAAKNGEYASKVDEVTESLVRQAKAEAALELIKEKQAEILKQQVSVSSRASEGPTFWDRLQQASAQSAGVDVSLEEFQQAGVERQENKLDKLKADFNVWLDALLQQFTLEDFGLGKDTKDIVKSATDAGKQALTEVEKQLEVLIANEFADEAAAVAAEEAYTETALKAIDDEIKAKEWQAERERQLQAEKDQALHDEVVAYAAAKQEEMLQAEAQAALEERLLQEKKQRTQESIAVTSNALAGMGSMLGAVADAVEATSENEQKAVEETKGLRIAGATMDMLGGIASAVATAMTLGPILGPIMGSINAATVLATGVANIAKIRSTKISSSPSVSSSSAQVSAPNVATQLDSVRNITTASEEERLNRMAESQKVYILQSDIEAAGSQSKAQIEESSF